MAFTTIDNPELYFQCKLYSGTGSAQSITLDGSENMQPDLLWQKSRSHSQDSRIFDSLRGGSKLLYTSLSNASATDAQLITSFDSDGFTMGTSGSNANDSGTTYVAWCWKESATAGFDILEYTGNSTNRTISHSLSAVPHMIILKSHTHGEQWVVGHNSMDASSPWNYYMHLQATDARASNSNRWQNTAPTSSVFSLGTEDQVNGSKTYIAYLFAPKQGFSKFGSYVSTGDNFPYIYTGFRPAWLMCKVASGTTNDWTIIDNKRDSFNVANSRLYANTSGAESDADRVDFLSNGFKFRGDGNDMNGNGHTYIYMAFAESPFVNSKGVPNNAR